MRVGRWRGGTLYVAGVSRNKPAPPIAPTVNVWHSIAVQASISVAQSRLRGAEPTLSVCSFILLDSTLNNRYAQLRTDFSVDTYRHGFAERV